MTNVISLSVPQRRQTLPQRAGALVDVFANHRRYGEDVFWLKENAELLNILECTGTKVAPQVLEVHQEFYEQLPQKLSFFPQYYRFLLSICLDLEDLGLGDDLGAGLCRWVASEGLPTAELSDLQRGEAHRLLSRRGEATESDVGLKGRLHQFINRSETFALPNKKAAYELTHIVFYLSEYGRCDPQLDNRAIQSLNFVGILAYLDQNADLLAETCIALRYAGQVPSQIWEDWILSTLSNFQAIADPNADVADAYHEYFVCSWLAATAKQDGIGQTVLGERTRFERWDISAGPLRHMSSCLQQLQDARSSDWSLMRPILEQGIDENGYDILTAAQNSTDEFEAFFEGFSRINIAM
jgi:hypothetical protein